MKTVRIKKNQMGDTRTATAVPSISDFDLANRQHQDDVSDMMDTLANEIALRGQRHDYTKLCEPEKSCFYRELCATVEGKMDFVQDGTWYEMHCRTERHHLREHCPEDVNMIDVIEMICDCVCAGMARSGSVYPVKIPNEILQRAVENTVQMCIDAVEVVTDERSDTGGD